MQVKYRLKTYEEIEKEFDTDESGAYINEGFGFLPAMEDRIPEDRVVTLIQPQNSLFGKKLYIWTDWWDEKWFITQNMIKSIIVKGVEHNL